jgi:5-(carboxyamino)imidazole ribonucleotide mutase
MPSGVAPMVALEPDNAALAAAKIMSVSNNNIRNKIKTFQEANRNKLIEDDKSLLIK